MNMKKKIFLASMFVLTLLLLMPSIQAIQHKTIRDEIKQNLQDKLETITLKIKENNIVQKYKKNKELNICDSEKIEEFVNSGTFKHLSSTYVGDSFTILGFIIGLITWIPAILLILYISLDHGLNVVIFLLYIFYQEDFLFLLLF